MPQVAVDAGPTGPAEREGRTEAGSDGTADPEGATEAGPDGAAEREGCAENEAFIDADAGIVPLMTLENAWEGNGARDDAMTVPYVSVGRE